MSKIFSYLPVIYKKSNITKMLSDSLDLGLYDTANYLSDVILQLNPYTVTWGLSYWENEYDISQSSGDTFDIRKARVLAFFNKDNRYNAKDIQNELKRMYNLDSSINVECENYIVNITLDYLFGMNHSAVYEYLNAVFPAHLLLKIVIVLTTPKNKVYNGNVIVSYIKKTIQMNSYASPVNKIYFGKVLVRRTAAKVSYINVGTKISKGDVYIGRKIIKSTFATIPCGEFETEDIYSEFDGFN